MLLIFLELEFINLIEQTNATWHILSPNLMLLYGNYMNNARLKWERLLFMYTLSCFDPLVNVMWKNMQEHKGETINHYNLSYKFVFDLGNKTICLKWCCTMWMMVSTILLYQ